MDDEKINDNTVVQFEGKQKEVDQDKIDLVMGDQQPLGLDEGYMPTDDADTQDLLRAMEEGEFPEPIDDQDFSEEIIPDTAAEMSDDIRSMVEELAGESNAQDDQEDEDQKEEDIEELEQKQNSSIDDSENELPDLEVKKDQLENSNSEKASSSQDEIDSNAEPEKVVSSEAKPEDALDGDKNKDEDKEIFSSNENNTPTDYGYPQQQQQPGMMQTSALGAFGHAFGSVINGVFHGIGMALGTGVSAIRQTKEAFDTGSGGATISNKVEAGAHFHFNPAQKAMENSFNPQRVDEWKQARVDNEFINLQTDMDAHIRSVDRLKQTEWAKKLHTIEESGDPEMLAKAPAILNMAKSKTDFKEADKDLSYFQGHIEQRAERLSGMLKESNQDPQRLEDLMNSWQEQAKKRLDDLPDSKDKQGILERIQNSAQNIMAGLRSLFGAGSTQRM